MRFKMDILKKKASKMQIRNVALIFLILLGGITANAGNKNRIGQAGAQELLINPWTRSSGLASSNSASVTGLESVRLNVSGLAFTNKTEIMFSRKTWVGGSESDININAFGFSQKVGSAGVMGLSIMSMGFGNIQITTVDQPEGGIGTFAPQLINLGLSFAKEFSNSIYGGLTVRSITQSLASTSASGVAFDAGIRYVTGPQDNLKFGIALRNVGPKMKYGGDGFSTTTSLNGNQFTLAQRTEAFELPSILNMGLTYDYYLGTRTDSTGKELKADHRITGSGTFTSNSFGKDIIRFGLEYSFREIFMVRGGYAYEDGILDETTTTTAFAGPAFGATIQAPLNKNGSVFCIDYSFEPGNPFQSHGISVRINL